MTDGRRRAAQGETADAAPLARRGVDAVGGAAVEPDRPTGPLGGIAMKLHRRDELLAQGVGLLASAEQDIRIGNGRPWKMLVETPVEIRRGTYEVERVGAFTFLGGVGASFRHVRSVGRFCCIAGGVVTGQVEHPLDFLSPHPVFQGAWGERMPQVREFVEQNREMVDKSRAAYDDMSRSRYGKIEIGSDVWIGEGAFIRRGVRIGDGAVVASRAVVSKDVPPYTVVGGTPAKAIRLRFGERLVERLLAARWWDYGPAALAGADFTCPEAAVDRIEENIASGIDRYAPPVYALMDDGEIRPVRAPERAAP